MQKSTINLNSMHIPRSEFIFILIKNELYITVNFFNMADCPEVFFKGRRENLNFVQSSGVSGKMHYGILTQVMIVQFSNSPPMIK